MFKLLTPETRERIAREYALRRMVVIVTALIIVLLVALIGIFPAYFLSKAKQGEAATLEAPLSEGDKEDLEAWFTSFNKKLNALSVSTAKEGASLTIEKTLAERGAGIRIIQLNWDESQGAAALSLVGVASDRQALLSFERRLKDSGYFKEVMLPVSNLAKERDINFQLNLSLKTP